MRSGGQSAATSAFKTAPVDPSKIAALSSQRGRPADLEKKAVDYNDDGQFTMTNW